MTSLPIEIQGEIVSYLPKKKRPCLGQEVAVAAENVFDRFCEQTFHDLKKKSEIVVKIINDTIPPGKFSGNDDDPVWKEQTPVTAAFAHWSYYRKYEDDDMVPRCTITKEWVAQIQEKLKPYSIRMVWNASYRCDNDLVFEIGPQDTLEFCELFTEQNGQVESIRYMEWVHGKGEAWEFKVRVSMNEDEYPDHFIMDVFVMNSTLKGTYLEYLCGQGEKEDPMPFFDAITRRLKAFIGAVLSVQGNGIQNPFLPLHLRNFDVKLYKPHTSNSSRIHSYSLFYGWKYGTSTRPKDTSKEYQATRQMHLKYRQQLLDDFFMKGLRGL